MLREWDHILCFDNVSHPFNLEYLFPLMLVVEHGNEDAIKPSVLSLDKRCPFGLEGDLGRHHRHHKNSHVRLVDTCNSSYRRKRWGIPLCSGEFWRCCYLKDFQTFLLAFVMCLFKNKQSGELPLQFVPFFLITFLCNTCVLSTGDQNYLKSQTQFMMMESTKGSPGGKAGKKTHFYYSRCFLIWRRSQCIVGLRFPSGENQTPSAELTQYIQAQAYLNMHTANKRLCSSCRDIPTHTHTVHFTLIPSLLWFTIRLWGWKVLSPKY